MIAICLLVLTALLAAAVIILKKQRSTAAVLETITLSMIIVNMGLGGLFAFTGHAFMADEVARRIGWEPGSPFQLEVAAANLAFGVLGLMAFRFRGDFWLAAVTGYAVFLLGDACVHVREILIRGNVAEYNSGVFLVFGDIIVPLAMLALVLVHRSLQRK